VEGDIKVETGVVQGNVFSSRFYIMGQAEVLRPLRDAFPAVTRACVADDTSVVGPTDDAFGLVKAMADCFTAHGMALQLPKTQVLLGTATTDEEKSAVCQRLQDDMGIDKSQQSVPGSPSLGCPSGVNTTSRLPWRTG
jgi:hypothetical protein